MSQLVTGDAVLLDLWPARAPTRMLSATIDVALVVGAGYLVCAAINPKGKRFGDLLAGAMELSR